MTAAKRATTFRLDDELVDALQGVKERHGIPLTEQVTRALELWLETMGVSGRREAGRRSMRLVERVKGSGRILDEQGKELGRGNYDLSVWQEIHRVENFGRTSEVEGLRDTKGRIDAEPDMVMENVGTNLVLVLSDGRRFPFFFSRSDGTIAARGAIVQ